MALSPQERGRLGNRAAVEKNPDHQNAAGKKGIQALASRYFSGPVDDAMRWLRSRQDDYAIKARVAQKHAEMLANGLEVVSTELPVLCDADEDPSHWRDKVKSDQKTGLELPFYTRRGPNLRFAFRAPAQ